jgi:hypothetical protein
VGDTVDQVVEAVRMRRLHVLDVSTEVAEIPLATQHQIDTNRRAACELPRGDGRERRIVAATRASCPRPRPPFPARLGGLPWGMRTRRTDDRRPGRKDARLAAAIGLSLVALAAALASAGGCAPSIDSTTSAGTGGGPPSKFATSTGAAAEPDASADAFEDYHDPGCPDAGPPLTDFQCDAYASDSSACGPGFGCYIAVDYPMTPCGQETYVTFCARAGHGRQGASCVSAQDCAGGFVCVVTGSGNQCVRLCPLTGADGCTDGLVCDPIDVQGFGGCL